LLKANTAMFQLFHGENKFILQEMDDDDWVFFVQDQDA
jgi:hypothetical protein